MSALSRPDAIAALAAHGIRGSNVYLLDVLPLIEMMWADGAIQAPEVELLDEFLLEHVVAINELAGQPLLSVEGARAFVTPYLRTQPSDQLLRQLRELVPPVRLSSSDATANERQRQNIIQWCLDIGAACVADYPYENRERFEQREKERFFSIVQTLDGMRTHRAG